MTHAPGREIVFKKFLRLVLLDFHWGFVYWDFYIKFEEIKDCLFCWDEGHYEYFSVLSVRNSGSNDLHSSSFFSTSTKTNQE